MIREGIGDGPRLVTVVRLEGELDIAHVSEVEDTLGGVDPTNHVVVDLGGAVFVDSVTLSRFIQASRRHDQHGSRLVLADARGPVRRVLSITGLDEVMGYADTVEQARALLADQKGST